MATLLRFIHNSSVGDQVQFEGHDSQASVDHVPPIGVQPDYCPGAASNPMCVEDSGPSNDVHVPSPHLRRKVSERKNCRTPPLREKKSNFQPPEDVLLARSWLQISEDSLINTSQKRDSFLDRIVEQYNGCRGNAPQQTKKSLQSRWDLMKPELSKFAGYMAEALRRNPSGMTDSDKSTLAMSMFADGEGKAFDYMHVWAVVKDASKWEDLNFNRWSRPSPTEQVDEVGAQDSHDVGRSNPSSSTGKRPLGRDASKSSRKKSSSSSSGASDFSAYMHLLNIKMEEEQSKWQQQHEVLL